MFEGLVRQVILGYLGQYIKDIQKEQLKITLWNEEVLLEHVELIVEAFDYLRLPFAFRQGRVGKLSIKIPWKKLGWDPIIIILEDVYICACQRDEKEWCIDAVERREFSSKKAQLAAAELAKLSRRICDNQTGNSFTSFITAKILDGIQVSIRNVHLLFRDMLAGTADVLFGLKFSSLTITKQSLIGSSMPKVRGAQVSKLIEIQNLELCFGTFEKSDDPSTASAMDSGHVGRHRHEADKYSSILSPLNVLVYLSVNRPGKLLDDAPQYAANVELSYMAMSINEVQIQQILSLMDYISLCQLREKYGRYRPWWSPLKQKLNGWQIAWWHYALESVLSDVRCRLRKTSWKYFGERLNSRRKYVNLYKTKLKCLKHDQVIDEDVQRDLEKMEKETDIDDILNYRSTAERELQDFFVSPFSSRGNSDGNLDNNVEDDSPPSKGRGWLNWLSYGMLGAGGTNDSNQFSVVISDEVIRDIYEATKFHPAPAASGDSALMVEIYFSSLRINISEICATLRRMELHQTIAQVILKGISLEGNIWEKCTTITASVNYAQMLNPLNNRFVLFTQAHSEDTVVKQQPALIIKVDFSLPSDVSSSVKVILNPTEVFLYPDFVKNIVHFYHAFQHLNLQQERVLESFNGFSDLKTRLVAKINYVLSCRKKMVWDINLFNTVVNIPWESANFGTHHIVLEAAAVSFSTKTEVQYASSSVGDQCHPLYKYINANRGSIGDNLIGFRLQDLYNYVEVQADDIQMEILMPPSANCVLVEKFNASMSLVSPILPDEPIFQGIEVSVRVPSLSAHFSALIYDVILGMVSQFNLLLPSPDFAAALDHETNELKKFACSWFSINASVDTFYLVFDLQDVDSFTLKLHCHMLDGWYSQRDIPEGGASIHACSMAAISIRDDIKNHVLFSAGSMHDTELANQQNEFKHDLQIGNLGNMSSIIDKCIVLHYKAHRTADWFLHKYTISASGLYINCHPYVIGKLVGFSNRITAHGTFDFENGKSNEEDGNVASRHCSDLPKNDLLDECENELAESEYFDHFLVRIFENLQSLSNLSMVDDALSKLKNALSEIDQNWGCPSCSPGSPNMLFSPLMNCSSDVDSLQSTSRNSDLLLININLGSIKVDFHDSSSVLATIMVPSAKSLIFIHEDDLNVICSSEGMILSSLWWSHICSEFLWGPLSSNLPPIVNLHLKKRNAGSPKCRLELNFSIYHVSCMLLPEFLAVIIGYFSLPDWSSWAGEQSSYNMNSEDHCIITYKFEIVECDVNTAANGDCSDFLKANFKQLCFTFSQDCGRSSVTKGIPSTCCINADKFADKNNCLDFFGRDLSLLLLKNDNASTLSRCKNMMLVATLSADIWLRMPKDSEFSDGSPLCIMSMIYECQIEIEEACAVSGIQALSFIIDQFSLVEKESEYFTFDVPNFLQQKKQLMENAPIFPEPSNSTISNIRFCVESLSLGLYQLKRDLMHSELVMLAEMGFVCSLLLMSGKPQCLEFSVSSLEIFSLLNSVLLTSCTCHGVGSSVLDMSLSVTGSGGNNFILSLPFLDVWLHWFDWNSIFDLLGSCFEHLSQISTLGSSLEAMASSPTNMRQQLSYDLNHVELASIGGFSLSSTIKLEHIGLFVHLPALASRDKYKLLGIPHSTDKPPLDVCDNMQSVEQNCFLSVSFQSRNSELVIDGNYVKLVITFDNLSGILKIFPEDKSQSWPLFNLSKINIESEISQCWTENLDVKTEVLCDSLDWSFSNHVLYLLGCTWSWFEKSEEVPSQFSFKRLDFKVQLRKFSLLLTDWKRACSGPLLEFLVENSTSWFSITDDEAKGSVSCDLQVNYYNIDKVLWEPLLEPWKLKLSMSRKLDPRALFNSAMMTDINLGSTMQLNLNLNEAIIEVVSRTIEMIQDSWGLMDMTEIRELSNSRIIKNLESRRYAPYMIENLTTVPLAFHVCQGQLGAEVLDVSPSKGILQPGSTTPVYINESPEELLFRYRPLQSSDRLDDKQLLDAAHRFVAFQLEGTSALSTLISMDLVGRRYFEVDISKSAQASGVHSDGSILKREKKVENDVGAVAVKGFVIPVVVDVSVQRYTKLMRLFSTVVVFNATSVPLEVRFDIPFGLSPKILGPIYPSQEFPLPLHLAEAGCIRWRPLGDTYLWSEAYNISNIISQDVRVGFLRSFVCYPSHPSSEAFRCCISVHDQCLPPIGSFNRVCTAIDAISRERSSIYKSPKNLERPKNRFLYQVMLTSPLVLKNYLMKSISLTLEYAGIIHTEFLPEVETSFFHVDSLHDLRITFQMHGFSPSILKFPRAESFGSTAKFSGTKFSMSELIRFDPDFSDGPLYVTVEKVMDAFSGAREILLSVPFLLYNCTGFSLVVSNSVNGLKGYSCVLPSSYNLDEKKMHIEKKDGLGFICSTKAATSGSTSKTDSSSPDLLDHDSRNITACLFSPDPGSYSGEVIVKLRRYLPSVVENFSMCVWSAPFSLVPTTGTTCVLVPHPSTTSGYVVSVCAVAAPFPGSTKIISFQPRYVIVNACTKSLYYKQKGTGFPFLLGAGQHSHIQWMDMTRELLLSLRFDEPGWEWSGCFLPEQLGDTQVKVRNYMTANVSMVRVEVRSADLSVGEESIVGSTSRNSGTNLILLLDDDTGFMPYRIDNHTRERLRIYQPKCESFETVIHPYTSSSYGWDEPCYPHRLIIEVPGERILGSYAIDDAPVQSVMCLPATSEKPERKFLIYVHSEGPIKVLSIVDSSYHVLSDLKSLHLPQLKDKRKQTQKYDSFANYGEKFSVDIPFLGVSLMNSRPEELLFACAKNTQINFVQSLDRQQFSIKIVSFQIDNQLRTTPFPVLLSFNRGNKGNEPNDMTFKDTRTKLVDVNMNHIASVNVHEPVFSLTVVKWRNNDTSLVSFESISLRVADFYLEIEQEIVLRLFEFCKTTSSRLQSRVFQQTYSTQRPLFSDLDFIGEISGNPNYFTRLDGKCSNLCSTTLLNEDMKRNFLPPHMFPIGAPWQKLQLPAQKQKKIYVELLDMTAIKLTLSFSSSPWMLRHDILSSGESIIHRGLMALADVEGAKIHFKHLVLSHQIASWESIVEILLSHYTRQFLHEMYKVFGSAGVIGNPFGFARSLGLGIKDFLSVPIWSVFQSPARLITGVTQGTTSLLSSTVYAISDATTQFSKAAHKGIVAFTFNDQIAALVEREEKGISSQTKGVINEFLEGLTGILQSPIKGAERHGLPGILSGLAVGVTGLVARPTASILEVTGKTAQSIRNRSRIYQMGYRYFRIRLPRPLNIEIPLRPYSWEEAVGTHVLNESGVKLRDETLVLCKTLKQCGRYVLITERHILVFGCSSLADLGKAEFAGVPADPIWVVESEIGTDSVILATVDGEVVHIVGSSSDTSFRQNQGQPKSRYGLKVKRWSHFHAPLPLFQTNLEFRSAEEASEFLKALMSMIGKGQELGWGSVHILHQGNIK